MNLVHDLLVDTSPRAQCLLPCCPWVYSELVFLLFLLFLLLLWELVVSLEFHRGKGHCQSLACHSGVGTSYMLQECRPWGTRGFWPWRTRPPLPLSALWLSVLSPFSLKSNVSKVCLQIKCCLANPTQNNSKEMQYEIGGPEAALVVYNDGFQLPCKLKV